MKIFEKHFEPQIVVVTLTNDQGTIVRAFTPREKPTWLHKEKKQKVNPVKIAKEKYTDEQMKDDLVQLVRRSPGYGKSFYTQLKIVKGGVKGSQERKDQVLQDLITEGRVIKQDLEKPRGKQTYRLFAA